MGSAITSLLVNGSPTNEFNLERELCKGDPISPFLFLIVVEGFNAMLIIIRLGIHMRFVSSI